MSATADSTAPLGAIVAFLAEIGLDVRLAPLPKPTFLPGILIERGGLVVDESRLRHPGDILHEAGHIAVADPARRPRMTGNAGSQAAEEMAAIAWSYAAALHIGLDPAVVFHEEGYGGDGGGASILANFREGRYLAVPFLQWLGMTYDGERIAAQHGVPPYPHMVRWLRPAQP